MDELCWRDALALRDVGQRAVDLGVGDDHVRLGCGLRFELFLDDLGDEILQHLRLGRGLLSARRNLLLNLLEERARAIAKLREEHGPVADDGDDALDHDRVSGGNEGRRREAEQEARGFGAHPHGPSHTTWAPVRIGLPVDLDGST